MGKCSSKDRVTRNVDTDNESTGGSPTTSSSRRTSLQAASLTAVRSRAAASTFRTSVSFGGSSSRSTPAFSSTLKEHEVLKRFLADEEDSDDEQLYLAHALSHDAIPHEASPVPKPPTPALAIRTPIPTSATPSASVATILQSAATPPKSPIFSGDEGTEKFHDAPEELLPIPDFSKSETEFHDASSLPDRPRHQALYSEDTLQTVEAASISVRHSQPVYLHVPAATDLLQTESRSSGTPVPEGVTAAASTVGTGSPWIQEPGQVSAPILQTESSRSGPGAPEGVSTYATAVGTGPPLIQEPGKEPAENWELVTKEPPSSTLVEPGTGVGSSHAPGSTDDNQAPEGRPLDTSAALAAPNVAASPRTDNNFQAPSAVSDGTVSAEVGSGLLSVDNEEKAQPLLDVSSDSSDFEKIERAESDSDHSQQETNVNIYPSSTSADIRSHVREGYVKFEVDDLHHHDEKVYSAQPPSLDAQDDEEESVLVSPAARVKEPSHPDLEALPEVADEEEPSGVVTSRMAHYVIQEELVAPPVVGPRVAAIVPKELLTQPLLESSAVPYPYTTKLDEESAAVPAEIDNKEDIIVDSRIGSQRKIEFQQPQDVSPEIVHQPKVIDENVKFKELTVIEGEVAHGLGEVVESKDVVYELEPSLVVGDVIVHSGGVEDEASVERQANLESFQTVGDAESIEAWEDETVVLSPTATDEEPILIELQQNVLHAETDVEDNASVTAAPLPVHEGIEQLVSELLVEPSAALLLPQESVTQPDSQVVEAFPNAANDTTVLNEQSTIDAADAVNYEIIGDYRVEVKLEPAQNVIAPEVVHEADFKEASSMVTPAGPHALIEEESIAAEVLPEELVAQPTVESSVVETVRELGEGIKEELVAEAVVEEPSAAEVVPEPAQEVVAPEVVHEAEVTGEDAESEEVAAVEGEVVGAVSEGVVDSKDAVLEPEAAAVVEDLGEPSGAVAPVQAEAEVEDDGEPGETESRGIEAPEEEIAVVSPGAGVEEPSVVEEVEAEDSPAEVAVPEEASGVVTPAGAQEVIEEEEESEVQSAVEPSAAEVLPEESVAQPIVESSVVETVRELEPATTEAERVPEPAQEVAAPEVVHEAEVTGEDVESEEVAAAEGEVADVVGEVIESEDAVPEPEAPAVGSVAAEAPVESEARLVEGDGEAEEAEPKAYGAPEEETVVVASRTAAIEEPSVEELEPEVLPAEVAVEAEAPGAQEGIEEESVAEAAVEEPSAAEVVPEPAQEVVAPEVVHEAEVTGEDAESEEVAAVEGEVVGAVSEGVVDSKDAVLEPEAAAVVEDLGEPSGAVAPVQAEAEVKDGRAHV